MIVDDSFNYHSHTPNAICLPHENATALYYTNSKFNYVKTKQHRYIIKNDNHDCSLFSHCSLITFYYYKGWGVGKNCCTFKARNKNWTMWQACKLTPTRTQISIQCERTSFLASFASSAGKKDISLSLTIMFAIKRSMIGHDSVSKSRNVLASLTGT